MLGAVVYVFYVLICGTVVLFLYIVYITMHAFCTI